MQVEIHELDRRYAGLRVAESGRQARLEASLAREGQQHPVLVVASDGGGFVLIDGYRRVAALQSLGRDVVEVTVLPLEEAAALVEVWRLEASRRRTALEDGWLLAELVERHGRSQSELAVLLRRSKSWVSRRLALIRALPESVQEAVRRGMVPPQGAMKFLVPLSRANAEHCDRLVTGLAGAPVTVRELERLYTTWRAGDDILRERLVTHPRLFLKAEEALAPDAVPDEGLRLAGDFESVAGCCARVRRRLRDGAFARANTASQRTALRSWREARLAFEGLAETMNMEVERVGPGDTHRDPAPEA